MPKLAANLSMMFNEVDFMDRFAAAASAGFKGVEYLFPYAFDAAAIAKRIDDPDTERALHQARHDLEAGADLLSLALAGAASAHGYGLDAGETSVRRLIAPTLERGAGIRIEPHPAGLETAMTVAAEVSDPAATNVNFGLGFVGTMARWGGTPPATSAR